METLVTTMEFVKYEVGLKNLTDRDTVWIGAENGKIFIYDGNNPEIERQITFCTLSSGITQIVYHLGNVFVAMANGTLEIFRRSGDGEWNLKASQTVTLMENSKVSHLLPIKDNVYAACGRKVWVVNGSSGDILKPFDVHHVDGERNLSVNLMAHSGIGLWVSLKSSNIICLYHTETFKHLQDINIASNVLRLTSSRDSVNSKSSIFVTTLMACKGLLWVGTNVGIALTIPLPRLEGVPIMSGGVSISYHAHFGPITFMLPLVQRTYYRSTAIPEFQMSVSMDDSKSSNKMAQTDKEDNTNRQLQNQNSSDHSVKTRAQLDVSPVMLRRRRFKDSKDAGHSIDVSRLSKTLPRGIGGTRVISSEFSEQSGCDVYGLYGDLIYVKESYPSQQDTENLMDPSYENLRRSDPDLAAIPAKMSTLDRRLRMKVSRPRSLDLSNWSVESKSSSMHTSSGSEESMALRSGYSTGRSVSRNSSSASHKATNISDLMNINENAAASPEPNNVCSNNLHLKTSTLKKKKNPGYNDKGNAENGRQTVITLTGGRGYINWRHVWHTVDKSKTSNNRVLTKVPNANDAHFIIWEKKV
ncbi:hypothetical protein HA402_007455 [Bradysia odoriphaga]|nr:hypothetical protein HA402_007455 [Bradysia odoriphaga]